MKNLDLNAYGVVEMDATQLYNMEGGSVVALTILGCITACGAIYAIGYGIGIAIGHELK